ncbi:MAG TPA: DsbC family protein [Burkholderiaceae bacterium]|nr:DsbC family protein [Burkholderiaceae bacterium]
MNPLRPLALACAVACALVAAPGRADEATIRKNLAQRLPDMPRIDEVSRTPMAGLWEVRMGTELLYTDAEGNFVIDGALIDARTRSNLTNERIDKLTAIAFDNLPLKDALVIRQGDGSRRLAVFADPNCGYCKHLERDLLALPNVTIYTFVYPILGPDSQAKSRAIWCAKDAMKTWRAWMIDGTPPPRAMGACDTAALDRNTAFGRKHRINATPALVFEDGRRAAGALPAAELAKRLADAGAARAKGSDRKP